MNANDVTKPLHKQVKEYILSQIEHDVYRPGETIPTERQLCEQLGVSRYTIRHAIQALVHEGYLYRVQGNGTFVFGKQGRRRNKDKRVGVIMAECYQEMQSKALSGIESVLSAAGYSISLVDSNSDYKKEAESIQRFIGEGVSGLIIVPADDQQGSTAIADLKEEQYPFVLVDRKLDDCHTDCVVSDNIDGAFRGTEYLLKLGHTRIGFVRERFSETSSIKERILGFKKAFSEYDVPCEKEFLFAYDFGLPQSEKTELLFQFFQKNNVTAIMCIHDNVAVDVVKMCREKGLTIPTDLSVVGFDDLEVAKHLEVPLTTVAQFPRQLGIHAAKRLMVKMESQAKNEEINLVQQLYYPTELVIRQSCAGLEAPRNERKAKGEVMP